MKPFRRHPLYHFEDDFTPRPKMATPRGFNWPLLVGLLITAVIVLGILVFICFRWSR